MFVPSSVEKNDQQHTIITALQSAVNCLYCIRTKCRKHYKGSNCFIQILQLYVEDTNSSRIKSIETKTDSSSSFAGPGSNTSVHICL